MRKYDSVVQFCAKGTDASKKFVTMMEDYAKHDINDRMNTNFVVDTKYSKEDKAEKINVAYMSEIERRTRIKLEDYDGNIEDYANNPSVIQMQTYLNKILLDTVTPILINATNLSMLAEFHYGGYGDLYEFEMENDDLFEVSKMGRRQKHTKIQERKKQNKTISMDNYGLSVMTTLPKIFLGESMLAKDIMLMALSMNQKIYSVVVNKFIEETEKITDPRFVVTNYAEKPLMDKLRTGSAWNGGAKMTIVGDALALKDLLPELNNIRVLLTDSYNTSLGFMAQWNGYDVIGFDVTKDPTTENGILGLPTDRIYGLSLNGAGKLIHVGIGKTLANTDNAMDNDNFAIASTYSKELGAELATNKKVVKCTLAE